jgi:hypothetical protein
MFDFLRILIGFFERNNIPYMLSGSMAMSTYTVPRFTRDFDFIVHLKKENIDLLLEQFSEGYYCDEDAVKEAIATKTMFNIIDHKSGYKADFMILKDEPYRQVEFDRRIKVVFLNMSLYIVSPEDLLISKLLWIQEIQGNLQTEDIKALAELPQMDWDYIKHWIATLKLNTFELLNDRHS